MLSKTCALGSTRCAAELQRFGLRSFLQAIIKADQPDGAYRLPETIKGNSCIARLHAVAVICRAGAPNFRQIGEQPVFGVGQPTFDGLQSVLEFLQEAKLDSVVWVNLRVDPVIYVNDVSRSIICSAFICANYAAAIFSARQIRFEPKHAASQSHR